MRHAALVSHRAGAVASGLSAPLRVAALLLIALWAATPVLAAASPPDPAWIPGLYDDADFDDVVVHIGLQAGVCDALAAPCLAADAPARHVAPPPHRPLVRPCRSALRGRAPPVA
jgi:hypothetical protein